MKFRQRPARDLANFERPPDALRVAGMNAFRRHRVEPGQTGVQGFAAPLGQLQRQPGAHRRIGGRQFRQTPFQRPKIKHGSPDQQGNSPRHFNFPDLAPGILSKTAGRIGLRRIEDIDQPMRDEAPGFQIGLGGADIHLPINQGRIHADDFERQPSGQLDRQRGFAGGGRPHQAQHGRP